MPIVFIHGVAVRDESAVAGIVRLLHEYVAPVFSNDPVNVPVFSAFWGDLAATFAWDHASLPDGTPAVAGMGVSDVVAQSATALATQDAVPLAAPRRSAGAAPAGAAPAGVAPMGVAEMGGGGNGAAPTLDVDAAADLFAGALANVNAGTSEAHAVVQQAIASPQFASAAVALDRAVREHAVRGGVTLDDVTIASILKRARNAATVEKTPMLEGVAAQGVLDDIGQLINDTGRRVSDAVQSAQDALGEAAARALIGIRRPLNTFVTLFAGDVFAYLHKRDEQAQPTIVGRVMAALRKAVDAKQARDGEPIIVLTHSMGGQLMYDAVTHYLDRAESPLKELVIDFWAAAASQVGLFEEMKLFKASSDAYSAAKHNKTPLPPASRLKHWWNVYDPNDFISYTAAPIFDGVQEARFMSDASPLQAHGAYLVLPRFYQMFADELKRSGVV
ncbi:MAG TPA: hypothetical protein VGD01_13260 [Candidatus Elarobacter sp.]|jgi:hypothetical protein